MQADEIARIVGEVLKRLESSGELSANLDGKVGANEGVVHSSVDSAVATAQRAQVIFQAQGLEKRREIIKAMRKVSIANAERMAKMAVEETGLGRVAARCRRI